MTLAIIIRVVKAINSESDKFELVCHTIENNIAINATKLDSRIKVIILDLFIVPSKTVTVNIYDNINIIMNTTI